MKYVSIAKSRAGSSEPPKKRAAQKATPETSAESAANNTNPDGGSPVSKPEEG